MDANHLQTIKLSELKSGQKAKIVKIDETMPNRTRFSEVGFIPGMVIERLFTGLFDDPIAFRVLGAIMSIRKKDAEYIIASVESL